MGWEVLTHLLNNSDLSNFHSFGFLKDLLSGIKLENNNAEKPAFVHIFWMVFSKISMLQARLC